MWIFTAGGFVSIAENYNHLGFLLLRATKKEHLREFLSAQGQLYSDAYEISETPEGIAAGELRYQSKTEGNLTP